MGQPWSYEIALITEHAYRAFREVLSDQRKLISEKFKDAPEPPGSNENRADNDYPKEFEEWVTKYILSNATIASMITDWEDVFESWLLGTIMAAGSINLEATIGDHPKLPKDVPAMPLADPPPKGLDIKFNTKFEYVDDELLDWINWRKETSSIGIVGTSAERVRTLIHDTLKDGPWSVDKVQKRLQEDYTFSDDRARTIARTEILTSQTTGEFASDMRLADEGIIIGKEWHDTADNRTRSTHVHANGQVQPFYEPFIVGNSKLMYPRDSSLNADAAETIQCRCHYTRLWKGQDENKLPKTSKKATKSGISAQKMV